MRIKLDSGQLAEMGINEEIGIDLPGDWDTYTPAQRRAWAYRQIEKEMAAMADDLANTLAGRDGKDRSR